ncbi:unnamed protein product [Lepidochelys olivacea]
MPVSLALLPVTGDLEVYRVRKPDVSRFLSLCLWVIITSGAASQSHSCRELRSQRSRKVRMIILQALPLFSFSWLHSELEEFPLPGRCRRWMLPRLKVGEQCQGNSRCNENHLA